MLCLSGFELYSRCVPLPLGQVQLFGLRNEELFEAVLPRGLGVGQIKNNFSLIF